VDIRGGSVIILVQAIVKDELAWFFEAHIKVRLKLVDKPEILPLKRLYA